MNCYALKGQYYSFYLITRKGHYVSVSQEPIKELRMSIELPNLPYACEALKPLIYAVTLRGAEDRNDIDAYECLLPRSSRAPCSTGIAEEQHETTTCQTA
jgi:hypothetical protein